MAMDGWSALVHRRLWHSWLWPTHRSHHRGPGDVAHTGAARQKLEFNDVFGLLHAAVATAAMVWGLQRPHAPAQGVALGLSCGMTLFGAAYFTVHDGLVHGRLPVGFLRRWRYFRRVEAAHRVHHRTGMAPYGLFFGPWTLRRAMRAQRRAAACASRPERVPSGARG